MSPLRVSLVTAQRCSPGVAGWVREPLWMVWVIVRWWGAGFLPAGLSTREVEDESRGITLGQAWVVGDAPVHAASWPVVAEATIDANGSVPGEVECPLGCHGIGLCASRGRDMEG